MCDLQFISLYTQYATKPVMTQKTSLEHHVSIENVYRGQIPCSLLQTSEDPVFNHGQQFRDWHAHHQRQLHDLKLLGKVFVSWQSRGGEAGMPVNSAVIADLKKTARLLHYCTSPLLASQCLDTPPPTATLAWLEEIKAEVLSLYITYLSSLGFQAINERSASKQRKPVTSKKAQSAASLPPTQSRLPYKCLQRSWPGGIIMVEILFQENNFLVKLYTLEKSRLQQATLSLEAAETQPSLSPEVGAMFSGECGRYKDFIHVHSFMHDFHLRLVLDLLNQIRPLPEGFVLRTFLELCDVYNSPPPSFIRNLLRKGSMSTALYY